MQLTITTTERPAQDLGYLLVKNPARCQSFPLSFGRAHVFYPEVSAERCSAALLLDLDPVALVRGRRPGTTQSGPLDQYVSDRAYVASSFLSVAMARVLGSALKGKSRERPELAARPIPLCLEISTLRCRGGEALLRRLFEPLGYELEVRRLALDERHPEWGEGAHVALRLGCTKRLSEALGHLYVLLPVLDDDKHYWVGDAELDKLLAHGGDWLQGHPARELITERYLKHQRGLVRDALSRLDAATEGDEESATSQDRKEAALEKPLSLAQRRIHEAVALLEEHGARTILDLGCGEGKLLAALFRRRRAFDKVVGVDVSLTALERAEGRLRLDRLGEQRERVELLHSSLTYRDHRLFGYDAACALEIVEHLDPPRLEAFEDALFAFARPPLVLLSTPNVEYNARFENLPAGKLRHRDHRFEWTRLEFRRWGGSIAARYGYRVSFRGIGDDDPELGTPTQLAVFELTSDKKVKP